MQVGTSPAIRSFVAAQHTLRQSAPNADGWLDRLLEAKY
jgi:hypothetical protein